MAFIGTIEQFNLSSILLRIERFEKTGRLVVTQGAEKRIELCFRTGNLLCTGPAPTSSTLGDRLFQAGVISQHALHDIQHTLGENQQTEASIALQLLDLGYVDVNALRTWAAQEAKIVLDDLLTWPNGDIYFEDDYEPAADRLLVALSCSALLALSSHPQTQQAQPEASPPSGQSAPNSSSAAPSFLQDVLDVSGQNTPQSDIYPRVTPHSDMHLQLNAGATFMPGVGWISPSNVRPQANTDAPLAPRVTDSDLSPRMSDSDLLPRWDDSDWSAASSAGARPLSSWLTPPQPAYDVEAEPPMKFDLSSFQPDMILVPADVSMLREQNPHVLITPDRWRLLTLVNGQTTLQEAFQDLAVSPEHVCQIAGELKTLGLISLVYHAESQESSYTSMSLQAFEEVQQFEQNEQGERELYKRISYTLGAHPLFAIVRTSLEENHQAYVDTVYTVAVGIAPGNGDNAKNLWSPFAPKPSDTLQIDIVLHASENIVFVTNWHGKLPYVLYDLEPQFLSFKVSVVDIGPTTITVDFYHQLQWLSTASLEFEAVPKPQFISAIALEVK